MHSLIDLCSQGVSLVGVACLHESNELVKVLGDVGARIAYLLGGDVSYWLLLRWLLLGITRLGMVVDVHGLLVCIVLLLECKEHALEVFVCSMQALVSVT